MNNSSDLVRRIEAKRQRLAPVDTGRASRAERTLQRIEDIIETHDWLLEQCPWPKLRTEKSSSVRVTTGKRRATKPSSASKKDAVRLEQAPKVRFSREMLELRRYTPVATVACIETYFRSCVRSLIDAGEPFSGRGAKLLDAKVRCEFLAHIQDRKLTLGELVSHTVRLSNLGDIDRIFSALLGVDFLTYLTTVDLMQAPYDLDEDSNDSLLGWDNDFYAALAELFEARHLYCHEFASGHDFDYRRMIFILVVLPSFVAVTDIVLGSAEYRKQHFLEHVRNLDGASPTKAAGSVGGVPTPTPRPG